MKALLYLYPPSWRRRYRREVARHLDESGDAGLRTALDLLAGAVDAWLNTDAIPASQPEDRAVNAASPTALPTRGDGVRFALTMIGVTLVLVGAGVLLDKTVGGHPLIQALILSAWLQAALVASWPYLRTRPPEIRIVILVGGVMLIYGVVFLLLVLGTRA